MFLTITKVSMPSGKTFPKSKDLLAMVENVSSLGFCPEEEFDAMVIIDFIQAINENAHDFSTKKIRSMVIQSQERDAYLCVVCPTPETAEYVSQFASPEMQTYKEKRAALFHMLGAEIADVGIFEVPDLVELSFETFDGLFKSK